MYKYGSCYSTESHGETFWEEWFECIHCGWRWDVNQPDDKCECEELEERAQREQPNR